MTQGAAASKLAQLDGRHSQRSGISSGDVPVLAFRKFAQNASVAHSDTSAFDIGRTAPLSVLFCQY
jgi:hypothetical protein